MDTSLWVKTIRNHRTDRQVMIACGREDAKEALRQACHDLDLQDPVWLEKNEREWQEYGMTRFGPDAFFESVSFQWLEIEWVNPSAGRKKSNDPRNAF